MERKFNDSHEGRRVILPANSEEGWEEERGVLLGLSGKSCVMVELDEKYAQGPHDDRLREVADKDVEFEILP